jgi:hypothetical protein
MPSPHSELRKFGCNILAAAVEAKIHDPDTSGILINVVISSFVWRVWTT